MSRRGFKTVNLPVDVADFIDAMLAAAQLDSHSPNGPHLPKWPSTMGTQSRDEYVRLAVAILLMATTTDDTGRRGLSVVQEFVDRLEQGPQQAGSRE